ncbi:MAG: hypothetical protein HC817_12210 [Saprospiraceae bacterium]|nr:hypothetical protein [Saprospiraceae bacterium]
MKIYLAALILCLLGQLDAQNTCRLEKILCSDSSFVDFFYDSQGRLEHYSYFYEPHDAYHHYALRKQQFHYFYDSLNRISRIRMIASDTTRYDCHYIYSNNLFTSREVVFFLRTMTRTEVFEYNALQQVTHIRTKQSDGDTIYMRFDYDERGYPIRRTRLSSDYLQNIFAEMEWDTSVFALNPHETMFPNEPITPFFDRETGNLDNCPR